MTHARRQLALALVLLLFPMWGWALNCKNVQDISSFYLQSHFALRNFSNELAERTIDLYIRSLDPSKIYFLQSDVELIKKSYTKHLPSQISRADCSIVDAIFSRFSRRYQEREAIIPALIDAKHDFSVDESLNLDRKKMKWPKDAKEAGERWRKRVKFQFMQLKEALDKDSEVKAKLHKRYKLAFKSHHELGTSDVYETFMDAFARSFDPHTNYLPPVALEEFRIQSRLSLEGIGALLRNEDGLTKIQSLIPGGAAYKSKKIKVEDIIVGVAQGKSISVNVIDMDLREVVKLIRGPRGTEVRLTIRRKTKEFVVAIVREKIQLEQGAAKSFVHQVTSPSLKSPVKVGVIDLPSFYMDMGARSRRSKDYRSSYEDVRKELLSLKKQNVDTIVIDLRSNGGGMLDEAIKIAGLFLGKGVMIQQRAKGRATPIASTTEALYDGPLVVFVDRQSASASEILAGAIQDYQRGLVVGGDHTYGKGTIQLLNELSPQLGAIKFTISKYYLPSGSSIQRRGVETNIVIPHVLNHYEVGEKHQDHALAWDQIPSAKHRKLGRVASHIAKLRLASKDRIQKDGDFSKVFEIIKEYREKKDERLQISLKIDKDKDKDKDKGKSTAKKDIPAEEDDDDDDNDDGKPDLFLKEAMYIATDYARSLARQPILAKMSIKDDSVGDKAKTAASSKEKKGQKPQAKQPKGM